MAKNKLLEHVKKDRKYTGPRNEYQGSQLGSGLGMAGFYVELCQTYGWKVDHELVESMKKQNAEELSKIETKIKESKETLGDTEVREAMFAKYEHLVRTGEKDAALKSYEEVLEKTVGSGARIDLVSNLVPVYLFFLQLDLQGIYSLGLVRDSNGILLERPQVDQGHD